MKKATVILFVPFVLTIGLKLGCSSDDDKSNIVHSGVACVWDGSAIKTGTSGIGGAEPSPLTKESVCSALQLAGCIVMDDCVKGGDGPPRLLDRKRAGLPRRGQGYVPG